jgi:AcrR family transcriptional regulator
VTSELLHEVGLQAMTTDEIAGRSGVSKATIYKWWPNKYAVTAEAIISELMAPEVLRAIWDRGFALVELRADVDSGAAFDLVFAPLLYRLLLGHVPLDEAAADAIVDVALRGLALGD